MSATKVIVYSAAWCGFCHQAMQYLDQIGVPYEKKDVEKDPAAMGEAVAKSGQLGIPVIDVAGDIIMGFDRPKLDSLLKNHKIL